MIKYENKIVANMKTNPKRFFGYLNSKRKVKQSTTAVKNSHGKLADSSLETANILAEFFSSTFTKEPLGPLEKECYCNEEKGSINDDLYISEEDVSDALTNLDSSKSMGPDSMHPKLLATLGEIPEFVTALTILFNACFNLGKIPLIWKSANIIPLHKKGSKSDAGNYRPISLTSIICKIYERFIRNHIWNHVEDTISDKQHGFVPGRSCLSNLLEYVDTVNEMLAKGEDVDIFFLDFQKAFDSVPHHRLLVKLQNLGITGKTLCVISDFLSGRTFTVRVGNSSSNIYKVTSGVPQGSVLGPLLFLLFINDLPENIRNHISLFADDAKMYAPAGTYFHNQLDLNRLCQWQKLWLIEFNTKDNKCKVLHIGKNNPRNLYLLNDVRLPQTESEVDLGVTVNQYWSWDSQIKKAIGKANACTAWVIRSVLCREPPVVTNIYKSLIRPHLEYCIQLWSPVPHYGNWGYIMDIEAVQRRVTRIIDGLGLLTYKERLDKLGLTTLLERRARGDLIETFKIVNGIINYGTNLFNKSTRRDKLLVRPNTITAHQRDFFSNRVVRYWNKLPIEIRNLSLWEETARLNDLPGVEKYPKFVTAFKNKLEAFKVKNLSVKGHYWELSHEIFSRINDSERDIFVEYMLDNPEVAKRKK